MAETAQQNETLTFVVRLWREGGSRGRGHWRARVENVGTGEVRFADDAPAIGRAIERWLSLAEAQAADEARA